VTVYSFEPLPQLPEGVGNAEAEAVLSHGFAERLPPPLLTASPKGRGNQRSLPGSLHAWAARRFAAP
jgi:hypothetical protein